MENKTKSRENKSHNILQVPICNKGRTCFILVQRPFLYYPHIKFLGITFDNRMTLENIYTGHSGTNYHFFTTFCHDHFCVTVMFSRVMTTFCCLLPLLWCANAVNFANGFLPGLHDLHWLHLGVSYMGTADPSSIVIPI